MSSLPLTLLSAQKLANLLAGANALEQQISALAQAANVQVPAIPATQIFLSSVSPDLADKNVQLTYPRVCVYSTGLKNSQQEKFRSLSGSISVAADIWTSGNIVSQTDQLIHFYLEAVTQILQKNTGDWGNGIFFSGTYEVSFQQVKAGGLGFVQSAKVTCSLNVSQS